MIFPQKRNNRRDAPEKGEERYGLCSRQLLSSRMWIR